MGGRRTNLCETLSLWAFHESAIGVSVLHGGLRRRVGSCHFHNVFFLVSSVRRHTVNPGTIPRASSPKHLHRRHRFPTLQWHCPHLSLISHQINISSDGYLALWSTLAILNRLDNTTRPVGGLINFWGTYICTKLYEGFWLIPWQA